jgi:hypothetical protein
MKMAIKHRQNHTTFSADNKMRRTLSSFFNKPTKPTPLSYSTRYATKTSRPTEIAIRKQNLYLSRSRVVPIQGVHKEQMFHLENELLASNGILSSLRHKLSEKTGRWSIMTTEHDFKEVCELLKNNLSNWTAKITKDYSLTMDTSHLPPIGLPFKNQPYDDESDGSFRSYSN